MLGPAKLRDLDRPVLSSLEDLVPRTHFYRHLEAKLDLAFVREWARDRYAERGRPSIDPVIFFKLQLIMFFEGIRSERLLIETASLNLAHRWYLGYTLDEALPDHSSLTRIRARLGLEIFERFFEHVVDLCQQAGLVWGRELLFDATQVTANADTDSLVPRFYLKAKEHVAALFAESPDEPDSPPPDDGSAGTPEPAAPPDGPDREVAPMVTSLPVGITPEEQARLAEENQATWRLLEQHRLDPERPAAWGYQRLSALKVSTTDPDAALMRLKGGGMRLGYHDHYVVDGGKARIILSAFVTPADVMENTPMLDLLRRVRFRWKLHPRRAIGDTTYGTVENIRALEDAGIRAYVPLPDMDSRTPYYGASQFTYDRARDEFRCPQDHPLRRYTAKYAEDVVVYRGDAAVCNGCPVKAACTPSDRGRQVRRSFDADLLDRVRAYHETPAYEKAMRKRQVWVEPLFGEAKDWHGLRRFRLRGLIKVNTEALLVAAGQNLKRFLQKSGWGRRSGPAGGVGWLSPAPSTPLLPQS
jgi:transposase